ncbi:MAG: alpha/beta fold hydrolase [Sphaerochaeta sp.]|nr:MAG: alpha/beta fold hydrolase [Sphaerochaeta sp.]
MNLDYTFPPWTKGCYQDKAPVRTCAKPFTLTRPKAKNAALLIHGYAGYPGELIRVGRELFEEGLDVYVPRLPGNGTSGGDFQKSRAKDWIGTLRNGMDDLKKKYDDVLIAGHSMGGALAVTLAKEYSVSNVILIAPGLLIPFVPVFKLRLIAPFIKKIAVPWQPDPEYTFHYESEEDDDQYLGSEYWSWAFPKTLLELEKVRKEAVNNLSNLKSNTLLITGGKDPIIPYDVVALVKEKIQGPFTHLHLEEAGHYIPYDKNKDAQEEAYRGMREFVRKVYSV